MSFSTHACISRASTPPRALRRDARGEARVATPHWTRPSAPRAVRHRGGRAARARVAEASAGGDASAPVIVGMGSAGVDYLASIAAMAFLAGLLSLPPGYALASSQRSLASGVVYKRCWG